MRCTLSNMPLNLSKSDLDLLLTQLTERLGQLKENTTSTSTVPMEQANNNIINPQAVARNHRMMAPTRSAKSTSMFNLDQIDDSPDLSGLSPVFTTPSKLSSGKSMHNLVQPAHYNNITNNQNQQPWTPVMNNGNLHNYKASRTSTSHSSLLSPMTSAALSSHLSYPNGAPSSSASSASSSKSNSHRRFVHCKNPDISLESLLAKRQQACDYRQDLDRQVELKHRRQLQSAMVERINDVLLDKKVALEQEHMKEEFDHEHPGYKDKSLLGPFDHKNCHKAAHKSSDPVLPQVPITAANSTSETTKPKQPKQPKQPNKVEQSVQQPTTKLTHSVSSVHTQTDDSLLMGLINELMASTSLDNLPRGGSLKRPTKSTNSNSTITSSSRTRTKSTDRAASNNKAANMKSTIFRRK